MCLSIPLATAISNQREHQIANYIIAKQLIKQKKKEDLEFLQFQCNTPRQQSSETQTDQNENEPPGDSAPIVNPPAPASFQIGKGSANIYAHSLAWPPEFGDRDSDYTVKAIVEYWKTHSVKDHKYLTFAQAVFKRLVDPTNPAPFAELQALRELSSTINHDGMLYAYKFCSAKISWEKIFLASRQINIILDNSFNNIPLKKYGQMVDVICKLQSYDRIILIDLIENYVGAPLTTIAAMADIKNVKYLLSKMKVANAVPLLHSIFSSPTIAGKLTSIIRFLELYDFLYADISWTSIDKLAEYVFLAINWIMEKCSEAKDLAEMGVEWVRVKVEDFKAKFSKSQPSNSNVGVADEKVELQTATYEDVYDKCSQKGCENLMYAGCGICRFHLCQEHFDKRTYMCTCWQNTSNFHYRADCDCDNNQDCFWRAVAVQLKMKVETVKQRVYTKLMRNQVRQAYETTSQSIPQIANVLLNYDDWKAKVLEQLQVNVMCETDSLIAAALCFSRSVGVRVLENESVSYHFFPLNKKVAPLIFDFEGAHYEDGCFEHVDYEPEILIPGIPYPSDLDVPDRDPNILPKAAPTPVLPTTDINEKFEQNKVEQLQDFDSESLYSQETTSSTLTSGTSRTWSRSDDVSEGLRKYMGIAGSVTRRTDSDTPSTSPETLDNSFNEKVEAEEKRVEPTEEQKKDFWDLLKNYEFNEIGTRVGQWFKSSSKYLLEWFQANPFFTGLMSIFIGIASFLGLNMVTFSGDIHALNIVKKFTEASRAMYYGEKGLSSIVGAISNTMNAAKDILGVSDNPEMDEFRVHVADMYEMAQSMLDEASNNPGRFVNSGERFMDFQKKMMAIQKTYTNLAKLKDTRSLSTIAPIWVGLNKVYEKLHYAFYKLVSSAQTRQEPVVVYLYGATNIGKSQLTTYLINQLKERLGQNLSVFTISKGPDFWNGFAQQAIARIDDMNAIIGPEGDIDSLMLFNLASSASYNPNMAALEDKNIMYNGRFVFVCSNHMGLPENSIVQDHLAWERRRDFFVHVSWPEHERECGVMSRNCHHWEGKTIENFDHLSLRLCSPEVSIKTSPGVINHRVHKPKYRQTYDREFLSDAQLDANGIPITVDQLIEGIIGKEIENNRKYELIMKKSAEIAARIGQAEGQTNSWKVKPHCFIMGPPGTGKSYILNRFLERNTDLKVHTITTQAQFEEWVDGGFKTVGANVVVINDLSLHAKVKTVHFGKFLDEIHHRNDLAEVPADRWIMCGNHGIVDQAIVNHFSDVEACDLIYRRAEVFESNFKQKKWAFGWLTSKERYKHTDIVDPLKFQDYVEYSYQGINLTQESVVTRLLIMRPEIIKISNKHRLCLRDKVKPTTLLRIPKTQNEFIRMINEVKVLELLRFISSGVCKVSTITGKDIQQLSKAIFGIVNQAKHMNGTEFTSVDDVLLQAWNSNLLGDLKGECFVIQLDDKVYYVDCKGEEPEVGILYGRLELLKEAVEELKMVTHSIAISDLMKARSSFLPHWLVLGGEILSTIFSVALTTSSAIASVRDQQQMFDAQRFQLEIEKIFTHGSENVKESTLNKLTNAMSMGIPKQRFPGPQKPKDAQYGDVCRLEQQRTFLDRYAPDQNASISTENNEPHSSDPKVAKSNFHKRIRESEQHSSTNKTDRVHYKRSIRSETKPQAEYTYNDYKNFKTTTPAMELDTLDLQISINKKDPVDQNRKLDKIRKEVATDPSLYPIIERVLKNCVEIVDMAGNRLCSGIVVRGRTVRTVEHILDHYTENNIRVRTYNGKTYKVKIIFSEKSYDRMDLEIVDKEWKPMADITAHFPKLGFTPTSGSTAILVTPDTSVVNGHLTVYIRSYMIENVTYKNFLNSEGRYVIEYKGIRVGYRGTGVQTKNGDCGSLLILADPNVAHGKVLGMHFAATEKVAYASPLRAEQYEDRVQFQTNTPYITQENFNILSDPEKPTLRAIAKFKPHIPNKTKLYRNWIPLGPELYEPSILCSNDTRGNGESMLHKESSKWCKDREALPARLKDELSTAMEEFTDSYIAKFKREGVRLRKLTSTEALNKMRGTNASEPINIHTSAGFPWSTYTNKIGKTAYVVVGKNGERRFNNDPECLPLRTKLQSEMNKLRNQHKGMDSEVIFQAYLKDELVTKKKIYQNPKTRTIAVLPLHALIVFREYFHAAHVAMMENWDKIGPKVGINPMSMDWHHFATNLLSVSTMGIDLDFSGWDFSHPPFFFDLLYMFYSGLYNALDPDCTEEDNLVRLNLYKKIKNFLILIGTELHQTTGGLPSGYPGTTPDNSIINEFMMYFSYKMIMKRNNPSCANITSFYEDVALGTYGDDVILAISEWASKFYNGITIAKELAPLGFTVQATDKGDTITAIKPILECTFLSRQFQMRSGVIVGPLNRPNLFKPSHFSSDRRSHHFYLDPDSKIQAVDIVQNVYESMCYNAALDDREIFDKTYDAALEISRLTNGDLPPTYNDCISRMFGYNLPQYKVHGLTFYDLPEILEMNVAPQIPKFFDVYSSRVCIQYGVDYFFGGKLHKANPLPKDLKRVLEFVNQRFGKDYNSVLVNIYPAGGGIPWHKDSEYALDRSQGVFGITLYGDGRLYFRTPHITEKYYMEPGLAYLMDEFNLSSYQHMRTDHEKETCTITLRRLAPPDEISSPTQ